MRSDFVVLLEPFGGEVAHVVEGVEQIGAQHFFAVGPIEAFDVGVTDRACRATSEEEATLG